LRAELTLPPELVEEIAGNLFDKIKPLLSQNSSDNNDTLLDVPGLCNYLNVTSKWIHERTHLKEIPYIKLSNKQLRFKKKDIDKWLESLKTPAISEYRGKLKAGR